MTAVTGKEQQQAARRVRQMLSRFNKARYLIQIGAYSAGNDGELDVAVQAQPGITALLQHDMHERASLDESRRLLAAASQP